MNKIIRTSGVLLLTALIATALTSCELLENDNTPTPTPLAPIHPEVHPQLRWSLKANSGVGKEYLKLTPAVDETNIYTASTNGTLVALNKETGREYWRTQTALTILTGPAAGNGIVVVGSREGVIAAYRQSDGRLIWNTNLPGEILANPAIGDNRVIVKTVDGYVRALSTESGHEVWSYQQTEPSLILRGGSAPLIKGNSVLVGFANGSLTKLGLREGHEQWQQPIAIPQGAFAIQRMIDIDATPIIYDYRVYAATYQGNIEALEWSSGRVLWSHPISTYTGMIADSEHVFLSNAESHVWAFNADSGLVSWRQTGLTARLVTGPADMGGYIVVGDAEGYLHWLDKRDGHVAARRYIGPIFATPFVQNGVLYAFTNNGYLSAFSL